MPFGPDPWFLGLDLSTQSLTALLLSTRSGVVRQHSINFDHAYPWYGTRGGVMPDADPLRAHVNPAMWLESLDDMLGLLHREDLTRRVAAVAVSAQQHGTVYLDRSAGSVLAGLEASAPLVAGLSQVFARPTCPIWMDSSTSRECAEITLALGGASAVTRLTGSVATERFAGPQIRRFWKDNPKSYAATAHVALISSFLTSVLAGRIAPVDAGDGFGTNLADIHSGDWNPAALEAAAPGLRSRLPRLAVCDELVGSISPGLAVRFGFAPGTEVVIGSGDNPCSLVGLGLIGNPHLHAVSLGTSDTCFGYLPQAPQAGREEGHIFGAADGGAMFLVCFKNGSLARERIRQDHGLDWEQFSRILQETPPGNRGRILLPYFVPEITPIVLDAGVRRFGGLSPNDAAANVRAVAEAQAMALFLHSGWAGRRPERLLVTAGGSENRGLLQVLADVFGVDVRTLEVSASAALGAALRAGHAWLNGHRGPVGWAELCRPFERSEPERIVRPCAEATRRYHGPNGLIEVYAACERFARGLGAEPRAEILAFQRDVSRQ